jgi:hypothetical protein
MKRFVSISLALVALTGCEQANSVADAFARDRAKDVVNGYVETQFPGVNAAPVTDCIIDAASAQEILQIAAAPGASTDLIVDIAQRPDALTCITTNSLGLAL